MSILARLRNEPRFSGSRFAPAGCIEYDTPGVYIFEWPDGVDRAVVTCIGGWGASDEDDDGGGGAGGPARAERLVLKTDATATINVGSGGATAGADGGDSEFLQSSTATEYCAADGGKGANGRTGGQGGQASNSYGTIKNSGGDGGDSLASHDGGGGAGSSAGINEDGNDGQDSDTQGAGGLGGAAPAGGDPGGDGGDEDEDGQYPGGGPGAGGAFAPGAGGSVSVCWEDPLPVGYCVDTNCKKWWGFGNGCGYYGYGKRCFYYGYGYDPPPRYFYGPGWQLPCCGGILLGPVLHATVTGDCPELFVNQTVTLYAVEAMASHPDSTAEPLSCNTATVGTPPRQGYIGDFIFGPSWGTGSTGVVPNQIVVIMSGSCWIGTARDGLITGCLFQGQLLALSCDPLFLAATLFGGAVCPSGDFTSEFIVTD